MNLFCYIPAENDATSFYRALQPISQLRKIMPLNIFHAGKEVRTSDIAHMDVVFLQRAFNPDHAKLIEICHELKLKVWIDYDDNLFLVPPSNPAYSVYGDDKVRNQMAQIVDQADIISVSTERLAKDIQEYCKGAKKTRVIPNSFNDYLFKHRPVFKPHNLVMWRGTQSHQQDMLVFSEKIYEVSQKNPSWLFNFMGYNPWFLTGPMQNRAINTPGMEIMKYHEVIRQSHPNVAIVTQTDSAFNLCKSNIAWIEATYAGAVTVAPDWDEWRKPGVVTYKDVMDFRPVLNQMLRDGISTAGERMHALSWEYIQDFLRLSQINQLRKELLEEVMS